MQCRLCHSTDLELVFETTNPRSLTSLMKLAPVPLQLHLCRGCGHLSNGDMPEGQLEQFYGEEYDLLMDSEDSQELFLDKQGGPVNKIARSFGPLSQFLAEQPAGRMLDFGCGKGLAVRAIGAAYPAWDVNAFEVSERYRDFLQRHLPASNIHLGTPESLRPQAGTFDLVTLFDVLEHVADPVGLLTFVADLVRVGGHVYIQVPDIYRGELDWLIVDHMSHYTVEAMQQLARSCGLKVCRAEDFGTYGSLQVLCTKVGGAEAAALAQSTTNCYAFTRAVMDEHLAYWSRLSTAVEGIIEQARRSDRRIAVFGTGTAASVVPVYFPQSLEYIECFIDENPYRIGSRHHGKPVVSIEQIPADVAAIFLGVARKNVKFIRPKLAHLDKALVGVE